MVFKTSFKATWVIILLILLCRHLDTHANDSLKSDSTLQAYALKCKAQTKSPAVLQMCDTLFLKAKENNNNYLQVISQCFKLEYFYYINDEENILKLVQKVKEISRKYNELKYYYFAWGNRLIIYYIKQNKINTAIYEIQKMLREAQEDQYPSGIASCYRALANIYITQSNQALALENFQKEIDVMEENNIEDLNLATEYAALAQCAINIGEMERAERALEKASALSRSPFQQFNTYKAYSLLYIEKKDFGKAEEAIAQMSRLINEPKNKNIDRKAYYYVLIKFYQATGKYRDALNTIHLITDDPQMNASDNLNYVLTKEEGDIYWDMHDMPKAAQLYRDYIMATDSVRTTSMQNSINEFASLLEVEQLKNEKNKLQLHLQSEELRINRFAIMSLTLILAVGGLLYYRVYMLNKKLRKSESTVNQQNEELKEAGKELRIAKERAESASMMKTTFIQNMSHEIRTPLNSIVGFSQVLSSYFNDNSETKEFASIIQTNSTNLLRLVNDVLEISYLDESEKLPYNIAENINSSCQNSIEEALPYVKEGVKLIFHPTHSNLRILTNPERVSQILTHLLLNATKFTKQGSITLSYTINEESKLIRYFITDTGKGIPKEKQEYVFERFAKLDDFSQGTGLGLPICRVIVQKMGGSLVIDGDYTDGCRFVLTLPLVVQADSEINATNGF